MPVDFLRQASNCGSQCVVEFIAPRRSGDPLTEVDVVVVHNGQHVVLRVGGDLGDPYYDAWQDIVKRWASKAGDLHREEVMQSDWPVF